VGAEATSLGSPGALAAGAAERWKRGFIAGPAYDAVFFILSPLLGLGLAFLVAGPVGPGGSVEYVDPRLAVWTLVWTYAHLCAVVIRSHLNPKVFVQHRVRFVAVPIAMYVAMVSSLWVFALAFLVTAYWDVYHSSAQNFGFCRIYDSRQGNPPTQGRTLDLWMNHVIYIGPILGGVNLISHVNFLERLKIVHFDPAPVAAAARALSPILTRTVVAAGLVYVVFYVFCYWRLGRRGYSISPQKICLLVSVAVTSIFAWGFLPPVQAFFVSNFFHALQYFGIVWWSEKGNLRRVFGLRTLEAGGDLTLVGYVALVAAMGLGYHWASERPAIPWISVAVLISLMHFWFDGFVWSVRKREVVQAPG
jgi:hypothetical protein